MSESNKKTALAFLDAMSAGDAIAADRYLTADAFTVSRGFGKVSGRQIGRASCRERVLVAV